MSFLLPVCCVFFGLGPRAAEATYNGEAELREWAAKVSEIVRRRLPESLKTASTQMTTYMVVMRDGTRLATDVYLPLFPVSDYPAIVMRTPYGKENVTDVASLVALLGYVTVAQDTRGRHASEGEPRAFLDDGWGLDPTGTHWDGYDTVEWVAGLSSCNGKVGMFGASALGIAANFAAGSLPPHLECAVVYVAASDMYPEAAHQGGGFRKSLVEGWLDGVEALPEVLEQVIEHECYDAYWQNASVAARHPLIDIPVYHSGGWYDIFLQGTLDHFAGLQTRGADPAARGNQRVIVGPWTHSGQDRTAQGQLVYPSNSNVYDDETDRALDWFDYWLKDDNNGILSLPPVRYYLMGDVDGPGSPGNEWREASGWPVQATPSTLFLRPEGSLMGDPPSSGEGADSFSYDPDNPVPTVGGANLAIAAGPYDQRSVESREDVLVYSTNVLTEPLEIIGVTKLRLFASSSARDTDWIVRLCDVYPDGRSMLVTDGILRAKFRSGFQAAELMTPGEVYEFEIDLWPTAIVFNTGHRIRMDLMSSNDPRFDPNPNTGDPLRQNMETIVADQAIYHEAARPSRLILPVTAPKSHPLFQPVTEVPPHVVVY